MEIGEIARMARPLAKPIEAKKAADLRQRPQLSIRRKTMLRFVIAGLALAYVGCAPLCAEEKRTQHVNKLIVKCDHATFTVVQPSTYWQKMMFRCDADGLIEFIHHN